MTVLRSIFITFIVSLLFGFALRNLIGFFEAVALTFVLQFVISFVYSSFKINKTQALTQEFEGELEQLLSLSEVKIDCPCGNYSFTENIFPNIENSYFCEKCNNEYNINISILPTLLTQPVDLDKPATIPSKDVEITSEYKQGTEL